MTPELYERVERLYHEAMEVEPEARARFLDGACGGDEDLRREVESLLAAHEGVGNYFASPALEVAAGLVAERQTPSLVGQSLSHYRVLSMIGAGGMGEVYLASRADDQYERRVAIKLIKRGMDTEFIISRFRSERRILASLDHPNIARLFDGGTTEDGLPYFVMEYIEGKPIIDHCDEEKLSIVERLKLFRLVCSAVQYAHQNLVVHRDIKPGNILITADGVPKLLDFGIAKLLNPELLSEKIESTAPALRLMTPAYASPEQVRGEQITTSSDVYSLGVVLYELLTGHRPYRFKSDLPHEMARVICEEEPEKPSTAITRKEESTTSNGAERITITPESVSQTREGRPDKLRRKLAGDLDNIVLKALRKEPERRYTSVGEFSEDILRHLEGRPVRARKDTPLYRSGKFIKRHKAGVIAAGLIALTLIAGIIMTSWQRNLALAAEETNRRLLYSAQMNLAARDWHDSNIEHMRDLLALQVPRPGQEDLRGFEWYLLWSLAYSDRQTLRFSGTVESVAFSPDFSMYATGEQADMKLWNMTTGMQAGSFKDMRFIGEVEFSPDGKHLAADSTDHSIRLWDLAAGRELRRHAGHTAPINDLVFSPDGKMLASASQDQMARLWEVETGNLLATLNGHTNTVDSAAFSPDGRKVATASADETVKLWDVSTGKELMTLKEHPAKGSSKQAEIWRVAFSPDGGRILATGNFTSVAVWDAATGQALPALAGHRSWILAFAFSRDGKLLATGSGDRSILIWDTSTWSPMKSLTGHGNQVLELAFSQDSQTLASAGHDKTIKLWDVAAVSNPLSRVGASFLTIAPDGKQLASHKFGKEVSLWDATTLQKATTLEGHTDNISSIAYSPDGKMLATVSLDKTARLWDVASGKEQFVLQGHTDKVWGVAFSPDGKLLATASEDKSIRLWDVTTGQELVNLGQHENIAQTVVFSPDGKLLASGGWDTDVKLWDVAARRELATLKGLTAQGYGVTFSPDGKLLAASADNTIKLWDVAAGKELPSLKGHAGSIFTLAFSPDGKRLASGAQDSTVRLWDVQTGQELAAFRRHVAPIISVAFSPDGKSLLSAGNDHRLWVWGTATEQEVIARRRQDENTK